MGTFEDEALPLSSKLAIHRDILERESVKIFIINDRRFCCDFHLLSLY